MLRRLAKPLLSEAERKALINQGVVYAGEARASMNRVAASEYLEAHEPTPGTNLDSIFSMQSEDAIGKLAGTYQEEAFAVIKRKKARMVELDGLIGWSKFISSALTIIQLIVLIYGQVGMFKTGRAPGA